ncbi:MAG: hypothetical protein QNJ72_27590 [Pleurocapsa sp. MO_226.B13]|nr:hypothetical protein [Pleurocapsa sp. MO_226.B13]
MQNQIEELLHNLAFSKCDRKAELLTQALQYESNGIDLLIDTLNDPELVVRAKAYRLLMSIESNQARNAIAQGILLNPENNIYCLY